LLRHFAATYRGGHIWKETGCRKTNYWPGREESVRDPKQHYETNQRKVQGGFTLEADDSVLPNNLFSAKNPLLSHDGFWMSIHALRLIPNDVLWMYFINAFEKLKDSMCF
jgi:hypothetical protein